MIKNFKKGAIGATLTWVVAFLIIFFIMLLFILMTSFLVGQKKIPVVSWFFGAEENTIDVEKSLGTQKTQRSMFRLLNVPVEFNEKEISFYDLIYINDINNKEASEIFNKIADNEFLSDFPYPYESWKGVHPWWVRVYNIGDEMKSGDRLSEKNFHVGAWNCNPNNPEENIVTEIIIGNKKIVSCIIKSYYVNLK